jgi:hypothetical protein
MQAKSSEAIEGLPFQLTADSPSSATPPRAPFALQRMVFGHRITGIPANLALHIGHLRLGGDIAFNQP